MVTLVPVRMNDLESIAYLFEAIHSRIASQAYKNFVLRGAVHGHDLDDWLETERQLIIRAVLQVRVQADDFFVEMTLPETNLPNLTVHVAPGQIVIASDPNEDGIQLCRVIKLPSGISLDAVQAERMGKMIRITAALGLAQLPLAKNLRTAAFRV